MKKRINNSIRNFTILFIAAIFAAACSNVTDNPLKDKETGEDINLLLLDFNFFNTRMTYKLIDASNGNTITVPATLRFTGKNGDDIVTFTGEKKVEFITTQGQMELTIDPNVAISENMPFEFAVNVEVPGYNTFSKGIQFRNEGKKTVELLLSKTEDEEESNLDGQIDFGNGDTTIVFSVLPNSVKSAAIAEKPYQITYGISKADFLKLKNENNQLIFNSWEEVLIAYQNNPDNFLSMSLTTYSEYSPEIDVINDGGSKVSVLFQKLETGKLTQLIINGEKVADLNDGVITSNCTFTGDDAPDIFGFAEFGEENWEIIGTQNIYNSLNFSYTLVKASSETLCETGSSITFKSNVISSFSIDADVFDAENNLITTMNFKGSFPETFVVENTPEKAVKLVFRNNNPAFQAIAPLEIANFCSGSYDVNVSPTPGYTEYQIALKAICPDNPSVAVAPTYSAEIKIKGSENPWQGIDMTGGIVDILGQPGQEYELRLLWEDAWEYSTYFTEFDANGNYLHDASPKAQIFSEKIEDGRIRINVKQTFNQNVCEDMGW